MDALSDILGSLRLESSIICRANLGRPFSVHSRGVPSIIFHAVVEGRCTILGDGETEPRILEPGDVVVLTRGQGHTIASDPALASVPLQSLESVRGAVPILQQEGADPTGLVCGTFVLQHAASRTLLSLLPDVIHLSGAEGSPVAQWLDTTLKMLLGELVSERPGSDTIIARLADVLFVYVLRSHVSSLPEKATGWLAATRNPAIGRAIALIHKDPAARWTASTIAAKVGMSRSSFFSAFSELVGEPPGQYVLRWRMFAAADLLARTSLSIAELAERVGYSSEDSFGKAFRREMGHTPSMYRQSLM